MNKPFISFVLVFVAGAAGVVAGCSAADPGVNNPNPGHLDGTGGQTTTTGTGTSSGSTSTGGTDAGTPPTTGGGEDAGAPATTSDGGTTSTTDAGGGGGDAGGGTVGPFKGLNAYASKPVTTSAKTNHANNSVAAQTPQLDCLSCHGPNGPGAAFLAAGWVATAAGGTTGAADVEVGVYATGTGGTAFSAHTDTDGYFWINPPVGGTTGPYYGGVRKTTEVDMPVTQTASDCNASTCHGGANPGPIHYP